MSATIFLEEPIEASEYEFECEEARIIGDIVWAVPQGDAQATVVPLRNVTGVRGDIVEQQIDEIESPGGRFTELVTSLS